MKRIPSPHTGHPVVVGGRRAPRVVGPRLRFARYLGAAGPALPTAPPVFDYSPKAIAALAQMYGNDQLGDCVPAAGYHAEGVATGNATGKPYVATLSEVVGDYSAIGGYVPGNAATDQGCDEVTAMNYWSSRGFANGTKLAGWMAVDPSNKAEVLLACWLFECLLFGANLPDSWIAPMPSAPGFTWDVAGDPDPTNGHAFLGCGGNAKGIVVCTWGMLGLVTHGAVARYCAEQAGGGLYALLTPDVVARGQAKAPNGIAWAQLVADFNALGGSIPAPPAPEPHAPAPPAPAPGPAPAPAPPAGLTLAEAQRAAADGLAAAWPKGAQ